MGVKQKKSDGAQLARERKASGTKAIEICYDKKEQKELQHNERLMLRAVRNDEIKKKSLIGLRHELND